MQVTDTIADLLTRIRNAQAAKHATVEVPASNLKKSICQILVDEGYVEELLGKRGREAGHDHHHPEVCGRQDPGD